ncbi:2,4,5-trihydroxytoluene oxygenase [Myxococcus sp. RHSTA-1-4]|uniref:2,4,5-trihydroxytoluene oxygenase n=1 Tax=Myxococcus sp. RHSTA-1-4 TaxID=2874601 RepID=UPI001CBAC016|nr:2,4,5-trihydroxytoluene oxygenase [Myxococcus sp. RHSTA-1-4]MBZ4415509.1 VOC family protein [Myxococcus sp. RHSTA-1-4]
MTPPLARHPHPTVKAQSLAWLMFERPDLDRTERFLTDFGLRVAARTDEALFLRGTEPSPFCYVAVQGRRPRFAGFGLRVGSVEDLTKLAALPGASGIEPSPWPGGGERVRLTDPSGFAVHAVHGAADAEALPHRAPMPLNVAGAHPRINGTQRPPVAPPEVLRLGHVVLEVVDFQATFHWYLQHFGFIPSDVQVLPDGSPAVAFLRLDLGDRPADHHTLALAQGVVPTYSHSAYEVVDADAVGMGHRVLKDRGWRHAWGVGRHILGSQIFDYWHDPYGDKHEHYTDGDLFTAEVPTGVHPTSRDAMAQWGEPMPRSFSRPALTPLTLLHILRNVRRGPDLSLGKLLTLARLFG